MPSAMPGTSRRWSPRRATSDSVRALFEAEWTTSAALWLRDGGPTPGGLYANPVLADTYERVVKEAEAAGGSREKQIDAARGAWYRGFVAEAIGRFAAATEAMDTSGRRHRARSPPDDRRAGRRPSKRRSPSTITAIPPEMRPLEHARDAANPRADGRSTRGDGPARRRLHHQSVEAQKLAFADRELLRRPGLHRGADGDARRPPIPRTVAG